MTENGKQTRTGPANKLHQLMMRGANVGRIKTGKTLEYGVAQINGMAESIGGADLTVMITRQTQQGEEADAVVEVLFLSTQIASEEFEKRIHLNMILILMT